MGNGGSKGRRQQQHQHIWDNVLKADLSSDIPHLLGELLPGVHAVRYFWAKVLDFSPKLLLGCRGPKTHQKIATLPDRGPED